MKQPKVYVKYLNKVLEVESINFDTKLVAVYDEDEHIYCYCDFEDVEFMENTGLKDKNGTDIYVGDIVEFEDSHFDGEYFFNIATIKSGRISYLDNFKSNDSQIREGFREMYLNIYEFEDGYFKVIGNIYENKELLEVENELQGTQKS
jgi:hypothetical protein